jgi:hypothetical protein
MEAIKEFKITKVVTTSYESYVMAKDWEDAEDKAHYDNSIDWVVDNERESIEAEEG